MSRERVRNSIQDKISRIDQKVRSLEELSSRWSWIRAGLFISMVLFSVFTTDLLSDGWYLFGLGAGAALFIWMVNRHYRIHQAIEKFEYLREVRHQHLARMELNWKEIPRTDIRKDYSAHPFAADLDLTGPHSLHHLIDTSIYEGGSQVLEHWLTNPNPDREELIHRQKLVRELIPHQYFRDKLMMTGLYTRTKGSEKDWTMDRMLEWLKQPKREGIRSPLIVLGSLSLLNILLALMALMGWVGPTPLLISVIVYLSVYVLKGDRVSGLFEAAFQMEKLLDRFKQLLIYLEDYSFREKEELSTFLTVFHKDDTRPSTYINKARKMLGAASLQANQVLWPIVNLVVPWDMFFAYKLENLKQELEPSLNSWLQVFYELEALNALAQFSVLHPQYNFPVWENEDSALFETRAIGHPLIPEDKKVTNDFTVEDEHSLFLITGSNMAGKSTFLRTIGVNLCLAFAGAPVNAEYLQTRIFRLFTSINVRDSLENGISHFYAEVRRLRSLLNMLEDQEKTPVFYFVDEIFKGTNNRERYQGSAAFLRYIANKKGIGLVTTHDLELASLEEEVESLSNWHFSETIKDGEMSFEYKLKPGPCPSTNALKIMKIEGLPVN